MLVLSLLKRSSSMSKKLWGASLLAIFALLLLPEVVLAVEPSSGKFITPDLSIDIPGVTFTDAITKKNDVLQIDFLGRYLTGVYRYLLGISVTLAIVFIMVGGIQWLMATGSDGVSKAKTRINNAVVGFVLLLSVYVILFTVNPNLTVFDPIEVRSIQAVFISTENTDDDISALGLPDPPSTGTKGVPYYNQRQYADFKYGECGTIKTSGCGPTSAAMVYSHLGLDVDPRIVAKTYANEGYRACKDFKDDGSVDCSKCNGTFYKAFRESSLTKSNNLKGTLIPKDDKNKILKLLEEGKPLVISVGKGKFTNGGHFIVLTGLNEDGTIAVNDPNSGINSATQEEIFSTIKSATLIERNL